MSARSSPPKMKMMLPGQRKHKSDFGETNPILPQAQETKTHLSAMTVYFCSAGLGVFFARPAAFRIPTLPTVPGSGSRPAPSTLMNLAKQSQFFLKLKKPNTSIRHDDLFSEEANRNATRKDARSRVGW